MSESENRTNVVMAFFSRPIVGIAGSIASIIGFALTIYFFAASREVPELTYFVHPAKAAVVRTGQSSRLTAQFDGQNLTGDVTATQIAIWNAGRRSIRSGNMLQPFVIHTGNKVRILEARLQKVSREVVGLTLNTSRLSSGEVGISWNILEQNDGGVVQIIYSGDENVGIEAKGVLEGQPEVIRLAYARPLSTPNEQYAKHQGWEGRLLAYLMLGMALVLFVMSIWLRKRTERGQRIRNSSWVLQAQGFFMIGVSIGIFFNEASPGPPFGF
jgi:hypothetical protein